jgi:hypothetical protein
MVGPNVRGVHGDIPGTIGKILLSKQSRHENINQSQNKKGEIPHYDGEVESSGV